MKKGLLIILIFGFIGLSKAQEPLSMGDAIQICLQNNFDIRIEAKNIEEKIH